MYALRSASHAIPILSPMPFIPSLYSKFEIMYRLMYGCRGGTGFIPKSLAIPHEGGMH